MTGVEAFHQWLQEEPLCLRSSRLAVGDQLEVGFFDHPDRAETGSWQPRPWREDHGNDSALGDTESLGGFCGGEEFSHLKRPDLATGPHWSVWVSRC